MGAGVDDLTALKCCVKGVGIIGIVTVGLSIQEHEVFPQKSEKCLAEAKAKEG